MNINVFFWFNLILGVFFVIYFALKRKTSLRPTLLNFKKHQTPKWIDEVRYEDKVSSVEEEEKPVRNLNVIFMWNGEPWDAYEILGLPAGSRREVIEEAFSVLKSSCSSDSLPFYQAAYEALIKTIE